ncbi:hypothetical protein MIR68_011426 [Amoeboaphelidium protococcarum]|nr:hypothetical protein MIR68_011426 [Amoeboaphelidium protococcarum]
MRFHLLFSAFAMLALAQKNSTKEDDVAINPDDPEFKNNEEPSKTSDPKATGIGDFIFENPPSVSLLSKVPLVRAGEMYRIKWRTQPTNLGNPEIISLEYRVGIWPDVTKFTAIIANGSNENYADWQVPTNAAEGVYIFKISTMQKKPLIRDRVSSPIRVFQSKTFININSAHTSIEYSAIAMIIAGIYMMCMII